MLIPCSDMHFYPLLCVRCTILGFSGYCALAAVHRVTLCCIYRVVVYGNPLKKERLNTRSRVTLKSSESGRAGTSTRHSQVVPPDGVQTGLAHVEQLPQDGAASPADRGRAGLYTARPVCPLSHSLTTQVTAEETNRHDGGKAHRLFLM